MYRQETIGKAFITALLLTGNVEQAEAAVLEGIRGMDLDDEPGEALLTRTVNAAIAVRPTIHASPGELKSRSSILPLELHAVLYLAPHLRRCFVLRVLLGWSREASARILQLDVQQIDERTRTAMLRLAYIDDVFHSARTIPAAKASVA